MSDLNLFSHPWVQAWALTLFHSLWQGGLIAVSVVIALWMLRNKSARLRHDVLAMALGIFLLAAAGTFLYLLHGLHQLAAAASLVTDGIAPGVRLSLLPFQGFMADVQLMRLFIVIWSAGVIIMTGRTLFGWHLVRTIRQKEVHLLSRVWQDQVTEWFEQWHLHVAIPVLESARIHVPMVVGVMKQMLLLPVGFFTALPPQYVKAILAHEAAHLLRRDSLVNLMQSLVEVLFFYHPAIWWISSQIRVEREYCCDDFAVQQCGQPMDLARALLELQTIQNEPLALTPVLSAAGRLQQRIKRLFYNKETTMSIREKLLGIVFLAAIALIVLPLQSISNGRMDGDDPKKKCETIEVKVETGDNAENYITVTTSSDSSDKKEVKVIKIKKEDDSELEVKMEGGKIVSAIKDGKPLSDEELKNFDVDMAFDMDVENEGGHKTITLHHVCEGDTMRKVKVVKVGGEETIIYLTDKNSSDKELKIIKEKELKHLQEKDILGKRLREELMKDKLMKDTKEATEFQLGKEGLLINGVRQSAELQTKYEHLVQELLTEMGEKEQREIKLKFKGK